MKSCEKGVLVDYTSDIMQIQSGRIYIFIDILCDVSSNPALHESEIFIVIQIQLNKGSTFEKKGAPYSGIEQKYHSATTNWLS